MKKLFFLLLVVNLVIWLWGQREQLGRVAGTTEPDLGVIRLLDEAELAARREQAASPALVATAGDGAEPGGATEPVAPVRAAAAERQLAEPADATASSLPVPAHDEPSRDRPLPTPAITATEAVAEAITRPVAPESAAVAGVGDTGGAIVAEAAPAAHESSEPAVGEASPAIAAATSPPVVSASETGSTPPSDQDATAEAGSIAADASAPPTADAEVPAMAGSPVDAVVPEPETASHVPPAEVAAVTPDVAAAAPLVPPADLPVEAAEAERPATPAALLPQTVAPAEPVASGEPAVATEPAAEVREVLYLCESLGPFRDRAAAARVQETLAAPLRAVVLREERTPRTSRYWVLAPVQPDREALAAYIGRLEGAGVRDAWRIPSGPFAGRLAVGVFHAAENARKHVAMLATHDVAAEVHAPKDEERLYWIDYERPADADAPELAAGRNRPAQQIVPRDCGRVAGP